MNENKLNINWYPGHMAKTKRQIIEDLKLIDVVIELLDARLPLSSRNPDIKEITKNKKKIIILNKVDLADENLVKKWQEYFSKEAVCLLTDANTGRGIDKVSKKIDEIMEEEKQRPEGNAPRHHRRAGILPVCNDTGAAASYRNAPAGTGKQGALCDIRMSCGGCIRGDIKIPRIKIRA